MKERPILFSAPMVRALLAGQKTQTRRVVKPQPEWTEPETAWKNGGGHSGFGWYAHNSDYPEEGALFYRCPYGQPGDQLWVKETTLKVEDHGYIGPIYAESDDGRACLEGGLAPSEDDCTEVEPWEIKRRPSIFMPRSMARILLEVISIRVERVQDISTADAIAEGIERTVAGDGWRRYSDPETESVGLPPCQYPRHSYRSLWEHINGADSWDKNPWVWVVEFKRIELPQNAFPVR